MARLRLHYSADEIINNLYTYGNEWMFEDTTQYIGSYHRYTTGEIYSGGGWDSASSRKLIKYQNTNSPGYRYKQLKQSIRTNYNSFNHYIPEIKHNDYVNGYINRYFIKKLNDNVITEISEDAFNEYNGASIDPNLYNAVMLKWVISGPIETTKSHGLSTIGVVEKNKNTLRNTERTFLGISTKLTNVLEFYSDTEYTIPADIN